MTRRELQDKFQTLIDEHKKILYSVCPRAMGSDSRRMSNRLASGAAWLHCNPLDERLCEDHLLALPQTYIGSEDRNALKTEMR